MLRWAVAGVVLLGATNVAWRSYGQERIVMLTKDGVEQSLPERILPQQPRFPGQAVESKWQVWVAFENYRPRTRWSEDAPPVPSRYLRFMERFYVLYEHEGNSGKYLLLGEASADGSRVERVVGWVRRDCVVESRLALQVASTMVHRKVMLIADEQVIRKDRGKFDPVVVVRSAPNSSAGQRRQFRLFNIFFLFGQTQQRSYGSSEEDYLLIGNTQEFEGIEGNVKPDTAPDKVILGWVPRSRAAFWNTREAVEWDRPSTLRNASRRRTTPVHVFSSPLAAMDVLRGVTALGEAGVEIERFRERFDDNGESREFKPHHMRYPILEWQPNELQDGAEGIPTRIGRNDLLKIGCIGGFGSYRPEEVDDLKQQLERLAKTISTAEILFVIDGTGTMDKYFDEAAGVVRRIYARARRISREVKVAVAFFDDTEGQPPDHDPVVLDPRAFPLKRVEPGGDDADVPTADFVASYKSLPGGGPRELVFRGIKEAVQKANFSQFARKLVVVIGDSGDRLDDPATEKDESELASDLLPPGQAPIGLFAVQVGPPEENSHAQAFQQQMKTIVRILNQAANTNPHIRRTLGAYAAADEENLADTLDRRVKELEKESQDIQEKLEKFRTEGPTEIGPEFEYILKQHGIDVDQLKQQEGVQLFRPGYVWRYAPDLSGIPQVRMRLLIEKARIEEIAKTLGTVVDQAIDTSELDRPVKARESLLQVVTRSVGENVDMNLSFEEHMLKRLGLVARSPLLRKPLNEQFGLRFSRQEIFDIQHRVALLNDILENKRRTWKTERKPIAGESFTVHTPGGNATTYYRWFPIAGSNVQWCWVDFEEEWP